MERKIGEVFEYNGEWYQCIEDTERISCINCCFYNGGHKLCTDESIGACASEYRSDKKSMCFKKLEKVGEPYEFDGHLFQLYYTLAVPIFTENYATVRELGNNSKITIEIKQNKEDMEESVEEKLFCDKVAKANAEYMKVKLNSSLKPFDIEAAKSGKPVCTRDGRKVRIICFDRINGDYYKIVACVTAFDGDFEEVLFYGIDGYIVDSQNPKDEDLMMLPEKKKGWINIYNADTTFYYVDGRVFDTKDEAVKEAKEEIEKEQREKNEYIDTIRVEWEE